MTFPERTRARFSSSAWGLVSILDRSITGSCITFLEKVGQKRQSEQDIASDKTIRILWTSKQKGQVEAWITREELRSEFPDVYEAFVRLGQIPVDVDEPSPDKISTGLAYVEVYIRCSNKSVAFRNPSNLRLFEQYWDRPRSSFTPVSDLVITKLRTNGDEKRVEIEVIEIAQHNRELFQILKPFLHPLQLSQYE